jgi:hypothetical protein
MQDGNVSLDISIFSAIAKVRMGRPEVVPEEAAYCSRIYHMFLDGMTIRNIAKKLTNVGSKLRAVRIFGLSVQLKVFSQ